MKFHVLSVLLLAACTRGDDRPAGKEEARAYALEGFESVWAETGLVVILRQGPFSISAKSEHGDLSRLHVDLRGATLSLSSDAMFNLGRQPTYTVTVSAPRWRAIEASAGVLLTADNLAVENLKVEASTGVQIKLAGSCTALAAKASAGASINASALRCTNADITATGGAHVQASASEKFHGAANAGAVIDISGNPHVVETDADVSGVITVH